MLQHLMKCFLFILFNHQSFVLPFSFIFVAEAAQIPLNVFFYSICSMLSSRSSLKAGSESAVPWFIQFSKLWNPKLTLFQRGYVSLDWNKLILDSASEQNEMLRFKKLEESSYCISQWSQPVGKIDDWVIIPTFQHLWDLHSCFSYRSAHLLSAKYTPMSQTMKCLWSTAGNYIFISYKANKMKDFHHTSNLGPQYLHQLNLLIFCVLTKKPNEGYPEKNN